MAFLLYLEGKSDFKPTSLTGNHLYMVATKKRAISFKKKDIPSFMTAYFFFWKRIWWFFHEKNMLPFSNKSWYEHPNKVISIITLFENLYWEFQEYQDYKRKN